MKTSRLIRFLVGLCMLVAGVFKLFGRLTVSSGIFSRIHIGGMSFGNGVLLLPFIIGIILLFTGGKKIRILGIALMILGIFLVILNLVVSASIHLWAMSLAEWTLLLVLIFGGITLMAGAFLGKDGVSDDSAYPPIADDGPTARLERKSRPGNTIEKELDELKRKM